MQRMWRAAPLANVEMLCRAAEKRLRETVTVRLARPAHVVAARAMCARPESRAGAAIGTNDFFGAPYLAPLLPGEWRKNG